ncbi:MAG: hypothetical protein IPG04_10535 [Polyangiaceae bacterium]|nr:hypothetical protein [Polyangiaceae bacterium]
MPEPAPPPTASPVADAAQDISIPSDGRGAVLGLEIEVLENIEKRTMEGTALIRIGLRLRANGPTRGRRAHLSGARRGELGRLPHPLPQGLAPAGRSDGHARRALITPGA